MAPVILLILKIWCHTTIIIINPCNPHKMSLLWVFYYDMPKYLPNSTKQLDKALDGEFVSRLSTWDSEFNNTWFVGKKGYLLIIYDCHSNRQHMEPNDMAHTGWSRAFSNSGEWWRHRAAMFFAYLPTRGTADTAIITFWAVVAFSSCRVYLLHFRVI